MLETIAMLTGYRLQGRFPGRKLPDVLRLHTQGSSVFLGEAKHTEGPNNLHSVDRLRQYLDWLDRFRNRGGAVVLAVAHQRGLENRWQDRVAWLCEEVGIADSIWSRVVTRTTAVTFLAPGPSGRRFVRRGTVRTKHSPHNVV